MPIACDIALVTITIDPVNDPPVAVIDFNQTLVDVPVSGDWINNDYNNENDGINVNTTPLVQPLNGTIVLNTDGTYLYAPDAGFVGTDSIKYEICDDFGLCDTDWIIIEIRDISVINNDPPIAQDDHSVTPINTPVIIIILSNDSDPDGNIDPSTVTITSNPSNGTVVVNPDGTIIYTPDNGFVGIDTLEYQVCDDGTPLPSQCDIAIVIIDVIPPGIDNSTFAFDDAYSGLINEDIQGHILDNDVDIEGDNVTITQLTNPVNGTVIINSDGTFVYTPDNNYSGPDNFKYMICDDGTPQACDSAIVYLTIFPTCITIDLKVFLEGSYELSLGDMRTDLNGFGILPGEEPLLGFVGITPAGHPYGIEPWNYTDYTGVEYGDISVNPDATTPYDPDIVDWVFISIRQSDSLLASEIYRCAGLLYKDGVIELPGCPCFQVTGEDKFYVLVEHRNHLPVMSYVCKLNGGSTLIYDFTANESWELGTPIPQEVGQKQQGSVFVMYAGNGHQIAGNAFDINSLDNDVWLEDSGHIFEYLFGDFDMNFDVNSLDDQLWLGNSGLINFIPR